MTVPMVENDIRSVAPYYFTGSRRMNRKLISKGRTIKKNYHKLNLSLGNQWEKKICKNFMDQDFPRAFFVAFESEKKKKKLILKSLKWMSKFFVIIFLVAWFGEMECEFLMNWMWPTWFQIYFNGNKLNLLGFFVLVCLFWGSSSIL